MSTARSDSSLAAKRLSGRVCIVTGGGGGIGRSIALGLAREGAAVCVADLREETCASVAEEASEYGGEVLASPCDVVDRESVRELIQATVSALGRLDVIYNNAGIGAPKRFLDISEEEWRRVMDVNALGVLIGMQEAARQMIAQRKGGKIINTASIAGKQGFPYNAHYCASKFAVVALTQAGARALAEHGITVNAFCPGNVKTEMWLALDQQFRDLGVTERPGEAHESFVKDVLLQRAATPDEIAAFAIFLATDEANYITGQSIQIDGGVILQ